MPDAPASSAITLAALDGPALAARLDDFATLLRDVVQAGASVSFILPFEHAQARAFWETRVLPSLSADRRVLLAAFEGTRLAGTVMLDCDLPPNQAHRGEVAKLLVHPDFRRRGIARRLMEELEEHARARGRWLVTLDTRSGDHAEPLYRALGFEVAGSIPDFARAPEEDRFDATTYMFKRLQDLRPSATAEG